MKPIQQSVILCAILIFSLGCPQKSAKLQKSVDPPDKTLFETGTNYLETGQYIKSRLTFQNLMMTYPDSEMAPEAHFAMGDSFYEEGGTENLLQAENQFKDFIVFYPAHTKAPDALMKIIAINMRSMGAPDRDQHYAYKALQEIKRFLKQFPDNDFVPIVKQYKVDVEENLAKGDLGIGRFYEDRENWAGAKGRYKEVVDNYTEYSDMADILFRLGGVLEKSNNADEAAIYYGKVVSEHPFSKRSDEAKARLTAMKKPIPAVNAKLAAANKARVKKPDGFSPLKPFIDITKALGFIAPPDRYEEANRSVKAEKAKVAEAIIKQSDTARTDDNILIESEIRKSAKGEARDVTVLRNNPAAESQSDADKKKEVPKNKKKYSKKTS